MSSEVQLQGKTEKTPPTNSEEYLTSREAAAYLHINHRTLLDWARKRLLPAIALGGGSHRNTWLFMKSALDAAMRARMGMNRPRSIQETKHVN